MCARVCLIVLVYICLCVCVCVLLNIVHAYYVCLRVKYVCVFTCIVCYLWSVAMGACVIYAFSGMNTVFWGVRWDLFTRGRAGEAVGVSVYWKGKRVWVCECISMRVGTCDGDIKLNNYQEWLYSDMPGEGNSECVHSGVRCDYWEVSGARVHDACEYIRVCA